MIFDGRTMNIYCCDISEETIVSLSPLATRSYAEGGSYPKPFQWNKSPPRSNNKFFKSFMLFGLL